MKSYLGLIPISAKVRRRSNHMTLLCIIFAVFLVTGIFSLADNFVQAETANAWEKGGNWHIYLENVTEDEANAIAARSDVMAASWYEVINMDKSRDYTIGDKPAALCGIEEDFRTDIMTYFPQGISLTDTDVILTPNAKALLGVDTGDKVMLNTPAGHYQLRVMGFRSADSRYATDSGIGETTALLVKGEQVGAFVTTATFRQILGDNQDSGQSSYYVRFAEKADIKAALAGIKAQFPQAKIREHLIVLAAMGISENPMATNLYPLVAGLFLLVLLAGVLMISGSLNATIAQRTQFFGLMRCLGMSKRQVKTFVRLEALNWCKTAIPIGVVLGTMVSWGLGWFLRYFVGGEFSRLAVGGISLSGIVSGALVGVLTVLIAAQAPAKRAAKVSPAMAVAGNGDSMVRKPSHVTTRFIKIETSLGIAHGLSSKKNLMLMSGSFALSIILFLCFSVLVELLGCLLPTKSYSPDISITIRENGGLIDYDLVDKIREMPGVKYAFGRRYAPSVPAAFSQAVARDNVDILSYDDLQLGWLPKDEDLRRGADLQKIYGDQGYVLCIWDKDVPLDVGDKVKLCGTEVEIGGLMVSNPFSNNGQTGGDVILICSEETFTRLFGEKNYHIVDVQMAAGATDAQANAIGELVQERYDFADRREEADASTFYAFALFIYGFLAIIALIAVLNIVNSISMSVSSRVKQYGAMRAVGMDSGQVTRMIASEASTYAVCGCVLGCGLGLLLDKWLYAKLITAHFPYFTWRLPVKSVFIILLFVFLATLLAVYAPSKRMRDMAVTETINEL